MVSKRKTLLFFNLLLLSSVLFPGACQPSTDPLKETETLMEIDRQFSIHSAEYGANKAFLDYIADDAVLLRSNRYPVEGKEKIIELFSKPDTGFTLTWEPAFARVSESGDLGYTYGIYKTESLLPGGETKVSKGTYVTIWRKDEKGEWKFVLDTGNPGLERKKPDLE